MERSVKLVRVVLMCWVATNNGNRHFYLRKFRRTDSCFVVAALPIDDDDDDNDGEGNEW